jgi:hypothetical protein
MGITEIIKATLKGMGQETACKLMVTRADVHSPNGPAFTHCAVLEAPTCLTDGYYEAEFLGHSAFLHRANGCWSLGVPWRTISPSQRPAPRPPASVFPAWLEESAV